MAATAAILDLVSVYFLTNAWVEWSRFFGGSLFLVNLSNWQWH
jgi:hypothetical protein